MKHKQTFKLKKTVWLVLFATIVTLFPIVKTPEAANAKVTDFNIVKVSSKRNNYTIGFNQNGDLIITGYYYSNSGATVSYHTAYIYFHTENSAGDPTGPTAGKRFPVYVGIHTTKPSTTRPGYVEDTYYVDHETLKSMATTLYGPEDLIGSKTVYMSEGFYIKERPSSAIPWSESHIKKGKLYKTLTDIQNAVNWSETTQGNFALYFDFPLTIDFEDLFKGSQKKYKLEVVEEGNGIVSGSIGEFVDGTPVYVIASPDNGWHLKEWKGNKIGIDGVDWSSEKINFEMPARDVKLTAVFEKVDGVKPVPTHAPVKISPIPTPAIPPTVTPTHTPKPTPAYPTASKDSHQETYRYFTTDKGYTIGDFADSQSLRLAGRENYSSGEVHNLLPKNASYFVGKDSSGNEWYFFSSGSNATYVHPKKYNGFEVANGEIKYIWELTFPSEITHNGTTYTVTSIGGGLSWYNDMSSYGKDVVDRTSYSHGDSGTTGGGEVFSRGKITGYYNYEYIYSNTVSYHYSKTEKLSYRFGVIGNGEILSSGNTLKQWTQTGVSWNYRFANTYEVYNTTLAEVTIPDTVTRIEDYAFANCNALTQIYGGNNVREIGECSFLAGSEELKLSSDDGVLFRYYHYNEAYALMQPYSPVMHEYDTTRRLSEYMQLPTLPALKTIDKNAFQSRRNLFDVVLPETLGTIHESAFYDCRLNSITIPGKNTVISGDKETLGTKGYVDEGKTVINTVPDSKAMMYGMEYVFYYKLRCGYDVTYDNNFVPEENFVSRSEFREKIIEAKKTLAPTGKTESGSVLVSLDYEGNLWFRSNGNIIPQQIDLGSKVVDIERIDGMGSKRDSGNLFAYTETGEVFGYKTYTTVNDAETPHRSEWVSIGVPAGAKSHQWSTAVLKSTTSSSSSVGGYYSYSGVATGTVYLFYVTAEGSIEYAHQGTVTRTLESGSNSSTGGYANPAADSFTGNSSVANNEKYCVPNPNGVKFKEISVASWQNGGTKATGNGAMTAKYMLPTIYATATDGSLWMATAQLETKDSKVKITPAAYVWKKTDVKQAWSKQSHFSEESIVLDDYSYFVIKEDGGLYRYSEENVVSDTLMTGCDFSERYVFFEYSFLLDKKGFLWFCPDNSLLPQKMFDDAEINLLKKTVTSTSQQTGPNVGYTRIYTDLSIFDTNGRMWGCVFTTIKTTTTSSATGGTSSQSPQYQMSEIALQYVFPAGVKKVQTQMISGSDSDSRKGYTSYGMQQSSTLYLLENGEIYALGANCTGEDRWYGSKAEGYEGYYYMIGPSGNYSTVTKVSGEEFFIDVIHNRTYSLALSKAGVVYRTGHYEKNVGDLGTTPSEYNPARYEGFTPTDEKMEYTNDGMFLAGYHFVEPLYDNMFARDGYTFLNWNLEKDNSGTLLYPAEDLVVEEPITLYAQWEKTVNKVRYHPNGGSGHMADSICDPFVTTKVILAECLFTKDGYGFVGWNTKQDGTGVMYQPGKEYNTGTNTGTTLYAQWEMLDYTLKVAENEVRVLPITATSYNLKYNQEFTIPAALASRAYSVGYRLNKKGTMSTSPSWKTPIPLSSDYTNASLEFIGWELWEEISPNKEYTYMNRLYLPGQKDKNFARHKQYTPVLFPYWGGEAAYVHLPVAECDGYYFLGWSENANETKEENILHAEEGSGAMYKPKGNETLYAFYTPREYKVSLIVDVEDAEPGDIAITQTEVLMIFDEQISNVFVPQSDCYIFMGYYDKVDADGVPTEDAVCYYDENGIGQQIWRIYDESVTELYAYFISETEVTLDGRGATNQEQTSVTMTYEQVGLDVIPPEKTGYTFQGYYTGVRGTGKKYFDANGRGSAVWLEKKTDILYAYWIQNPVEIPEKNPADYPDIVPEERVEIEAALEKSVVHIYADDNDPTTGAMTDVQPYLVSDIVVNGKPEVSGAIPSTENVAIRAKMGAWMLSSILEHRTGVEYVRVHVTVPYQTQYEDAETEELIISDMQHMTYEFMVPKAWSYWIVADGGIYFPEKVVVENAALGEDAIEIPVAWECEDAINKPTYRITSYGGKENHVMWNSMEPGKSFDDDGTPSLTIMLEKQEYIISDTPGELPDIASHLRNVCYNAAWQDTTQFSVKSDHISVAGRTLLADSLEHTGIGVGPSMWEIEHIGEKIQETAYNQTYKSEVPLQIDVKNGRYETEAKVIYKADISNVGSVTEKQVEGKETNEINIHTPVVCVPIIQADHKDMYQCENVPEGNTVLVLDEEGKHSDFVLRIDNKGYHSDKKGYGERTYIDFLAQKDGKKQNEVCFPFSVWVDAENDGDSANDVYLEAGEWYLLGSGEQRFYMPVWTKEGCYEIMFRSVAINGVGLEEKKEEYCNSQGSHYVAEGKIKVYLTGRLYDFAVNGIGGSAMWEEVKQEELCYTVGLQESSGSIWDTLPLRTGVHPSYRNGGGVSMGGFIDFRLKSIGRSFEADTILTVIPRFVSVQDGNYRTVDVYYEKETESGIFLKRWDGDSQCILLMMKENAKSDRQYLEELQLTEEGKRIIDLYESEIENTIREWQGRFYLPDKLYVAKEGADVLGYQAQFGLTFTEEFWVLNEPLMLSFEMCIENEQGDILYYGMIPDNIVNNIWQREAKSSYREDGKGNRFRILGGETAVIYPGDSAKKDYIIYGIY